MFFKLIPVPAIRPRIPKITMKAFLMTTKQNFEPDNEYQNVAVSMMAGKANPSAARHKAPKSDIKRSSSGTATAKRTEIKREKILEEKNVEK